jgi:hypothetical protein
MNFLNRGEGEGRVGKVSECWQRRVEGDAYWSEFLNDGQVVGGNTVRFDHLCFQGSGESRVIVNNQGERISFVETEIVTENYRNSELSELERKSRIDGQSIEWLRILDKAV